ncbi:MAG: hypothetical protein HYV41_02040 [Candidatus Magasanikbacteria bacterium]|nr:hypothetical protein [Candidatus Magasanikbacteria bacterium]
MKIFLNKFFIVLVVLVLLVSGYYVYINKFEDTENNVSVDTEFEENNLPEGVEIVERDGGRELIDSVSNYKIFLDDNWKVSSPTNIVNISLNQELFPIEFSQSFYILKNDIRSSDLKAETDDWLSLQNEDCPECYKFEKNINIENLKISVIQDVVALGDYKDYLFIKNGKLYDFSTINISEEDAIILIKKTKFDL